MSRKLKVGISSNDLERIIRIIKKCPKIEDAILFGSRAKGTFSNGSDIDIALKGKDILLNDILDLSIELDELYLPYKFDLIIYDRIKEDALKDHINRIGISLT
ncbi:MAG: nucleotidyltransferase domain-containing protein [Marinilabiliaceae bacterium]|nr:nucleotidyltransferase domain-containing protein [Marinilabiliaceae bacterium]